MAEKDLDQETLAAQKEELERQQRILELKKSAMTAMNKPAMVSCGTGTSVGIGTANTDQDSQLKSLLQCKHKLVKVGLFNSDMSIKAVLLV